MDVELEKVLDLFWRKKNHIFNCLSNEKYVSEQLLLLREYIRK